MSTVAQPRRIEARFFAEGRPVDEATFWREVERLAAQGARAQITAGEVRWRLTPRGEAALRLIREQESGR
jgi:hypothetical protein